MDGTNLILQIYLNEQELNEWFLARLSEEVGVKLKRVGVCESQAMYFLKKVTGEAFTRDDLSKVMQNKNVLKAFLLNVE